MDAVKNFTPPTWDFSGFGQENRPTVGSRCQETPYELKDWIQYGLIPASVITIVFAFLQPRVRLWPNCCKMRPSIPSPANLIDSYEDRWSFACAFSAMSTCVITLFTGQWFYTFDISHIPSMLQGTVVVLIALLNVLAISMAYYPLLLSLSTDHLILGNVIGLVYTTIWSYYYIATLASCPGESGIEARVISAILGPVFICYIALLGRFCYGLYSGFHKLFWPEEKSSTSITTINANFEDGFTQSHFYQRVQYLLSPPKQEGEVTLTVKLRRKLFQDAPGFKFSRRAVYTFVLSALTTYQLGLIYVLSLSEVWHSANQTLAVNGDLYNIFAKVNETSLFYEIKYFFDAAEDTFWPTCYFAIATTVGYSLHMLICYRKHTLRLWRGNRDFCPRATASFSSLVVANLRYSGYHIGFSIWGFFILQILSWLIVFFIVYFIIYPLRQGTETTLINFLRDYWLTLALGLVWYYAQVFLSHIAFLQSDKEDKKNKKTFLSLNNRRAFSVTVYVTLFMNVILGLASCLMRILKSVLFGVLFIGRTDRSVLMRGWELWDPGFKAYIGFLQLEVAHTHPVVVTFCHLLWKSIEKNKGTQHSNYKTFRASTDVETGTSPPARLKSRRLRNRWFVAITLMRNRALTLSRVPVLPELQQVREESKNTTTDSVVKRRLPRPRSLQRRSFESAYDRLDSLDTPSSSPCDEASAIMPAAACVQTGSSPKETDSLLSSAVKKTEMAQDKTDPISVPLQPVILTLEGHSPGKTEA